MAKTKKRGPAPIRGTENQKSTISVRISPALKSQFVDVTKANDRSLSQEAELRLEQSFRDQKLMVDAMVLVYGRPLAGLILEVADLMKHTGQLVSLHAGQIQVDRWIDLPLAYSEATKAASALIQGFKPAGEIVPLPTPKFPDNPELQAHWAEMADNPGERAAYFEIAQLIDERAGPWKESRRINRELLGHLLDRAKKRFLDRAKKRRETEASGVAPAGEK